MLYTNRPWVEGLFSLLLIVVVPTFQWYQKSRTILDQPTELEILKDAYKDSIYVSKKIILSNGDYLTHQS